MAARGDGSNRLARMLYLYRTVNRLSLREMEKETGISHVTLMRIEHGHHMDVGTWLKFQEWLFETVGPAPRTRLADPVRDRG